MLIIREREREREREIPTRCRKRNWLGWPFCWINKYLCTSFPEYQKCDN